MHLHTHCVCLQGTVGRWGGTRLPCLSRVEPSLRPRFVEGHPTFYLLYLLGGALWVTFVIEMNSMKPSPPAQRRGGVETMFPSSCCPVLFAELRGRK